MDNDAVTYLLNFALEHKIGFDLIPELNPETPSFAVNSNRIIVINVSWHNQRELPFQIAHEISHVLNNDPDVLYSSSPASKTKIEAAANERAIDLLIGYANSVGLYHMDVYKFMEYFALPGNVKTTVIDKLENKIIYY